MGSEREKSEKELSQMAEGRLRAITAKIRQGDSIKPIVNQPGKIEQPIANAVSDVRGISGLGASEEIVN